MANKLIPILIEVSMILAAAYMALHKEYDQGVFFLVLGMYIRIINLTPNC